MPTVIRGCAELGYMFDCKKRRVVDFKGTQVMIYSLVDRPLVVSLSIHVIPWERSYRGMSNAIYEISSPTL